MTVTKQQQLEWLVLNIDDFFGCDVVHMSTHLIGEKRMVLDSKYHAITREEWQQELDKMQKQDGKVMSENEFEDELEKMYWDFDAERAKKSKCERLNFKMFMRIASGLRVERKQDNSWHERVELPPIGCECEVFDGEDWLQSFIVGRSRSGDVVVQTMAGYFEASHAKFRPLRTEREKAIDELIEIICAGGELSKDGSASREIAERIYETGYRKEQSK